MEWSGLVRRTVKSSSSPGWLHAGGIVGELSGEFLYNSSIPITYSSFPGFLYVLFNHREKNLFRDYLSSAVCVYVCLYVCMSLRLQPQR